MNRPLLLFVRRRMLAPSALHVVEGGNHSLEVGVRALRERGQTQGDVDDAILDAVRGFLREHVQERHRPPEA